MSNPKETDQKAKLQAFKEKITSEAESVLKDFFPQKIVELGEMYQKMLASSAREAIVGETSVRGEAVDERKALLEPSAKRPRLSEDTKTSPNKKMEKTQPCSDIVPCNKDVNALIQWLKPEIRLFLQKLGVLRLWVHLLIPHVDDSSSIGVKIQQSLVDGIKAVEVGLNDYMKGLVAHHHERAAIASKVLKYPNITDYMRALEEFDDREMHSLTNNIREIRDFYCAIHDLITKNMNKIKKPRSTNAETLY